METRWTHTTSENFATLREASKDTCLIPMGCIEKHGLHLPLGTDILHTSKIAYMASQLETVTVFPDFTFGDVPGLELDMQRIGEGAIILPIETQLLLLEQLCASIEQNGFKKILVYNGHGGNGPWLDVFNRNLVNKKHNYAFATVFMQGEIPHRMGEILLEQGSGAIPELEPKDEELIIKYHLAGMKGGHACMSETAYMMGVAPETVHLDRLGIESGARVDCVKHFRDAGISIRDEGWIMLYPNNFAGDDPIGCNERIGQAALRMEAERLANAIKVFKEDEVLPNWEKEFRRR